MCQFLNMRTKYNFLCSSFTFSARFVNSFRFMSPDMDVYYVAQDLLMPKEMPVFFFFSNSSFKGTITLMRTKDKMDYSPSTASRD